MPIFERNGARLHYELDGTGPDAVYIPGLGSHSNDFLAQAMRAGLSQHYRLLTVDNQGSGQSVTPAGVSITVNDMADDVAALMEHVGMHTAVILGISMGGMVGLTLAVRHSQRVQRLVVAVTSAWNQPEPNRAAFILQLGRDLRDMGLPRSIVNRNSVLTLLGEEVFSEMPLFIDGWVNGPPDPLEQSKANFELQTAALQGYDVRDQLKTLNIPTLVLSSPEDLLVPPHFQDEIAALIPGAQIKRYNGGHVFMMLPQYTPSFLADVLSFWNG